MTVLKHSLMGCACPPSPCQKPPKKQADDKVSTNSFTYHVGEMIFIAGKLSRNGAVTNAENMFARVFVPGKPEEYETVEMDKGFEEDEEVYWARIDTNGMKGVYIIRFVVTGENEGEMVVADSDIIVTIVD